ncbi:hypothetical protein FA13DRAFT_284387 [Coprinellus micaceus]|uniref:Uncharacterized protein n=1 Tax=Coprinellus micaceus TaxID=71717 RepID=A0A4Y7TD51_COPMI|nr:hypothetical protein FA13DRAFT_284387 [Coprinellus micaceus]
MVCTRYGAILIPRGTNRGFPKLSAHPTKTHSRLQACTCPSPLPLFNAERRHSTFASQMVPKDRIESFAPTQVFSPTSTTSQGLQAFTGAHSFTGENLDLTVAGGNLARHVHSHTHFHWKPRLYLGGALAGEVKLGPPMRSDGDFPLYVLSNGILLFLLIKPRGFIRSKRRDPYR